MPPFIVMAGAGFLGAGLLALLAGRRPDTAAGLDRLTNPMALGAALSFGVVLVVVMLVTHYLRLWLGEGGVYAAAALSGLTDVDALTISVARLSREGLAITAAANAIVLAVSVNTIVKSAVALFVGGTGFGLRVLAVYCATLVAGLAALWLAP